MWTMRCSKSDIKLFRSCFLFFLSLVNKYCLTHSFWWFLGSKKKKKHTWVCWLHTLGDVSFSSTTSTSPTDVQLFKGLQTDQLNLINIQVKITFSACVTTFTIDTDSQNVFSTPTRNPESSGALLENFQPDLFHLHTDILFTDCMKMSYYSVLKIDVESSNIPWVKNIFFIALFSSLPFSFKMCLV